MSPQNPLISIVVPCYNSGIFIEQTLCSIFSQCFDDYELLVLDAGSNDMSLPILKSYADRFSYFRSRKDEGHYASLNEGFSHARGEVFLWLNSDDLLHPGALRNVARTYLEKSDKFDLFTGFPTLFDASGRIQRIYYKKFFWSLDHFLNLNPSHMPHYMQQESTFFTKKIWKKVGGLRHKEFPLAADFDLWLRMACHTEILEVESLIGGFRFHGKNRSTDYTEYASQVAASQKEVRKSLDLTSTSKPISDKGEFGTSASLSIDLESKSHAYPRIKLFTSLAPKSLERQRDCVTNWISNGFDAVSLNSDSEMSQLSNIISEISYQAPRYSLEKIWGKPYVSMSSFVDECSKVNGFSGIINSDIRFLMPRSFESILANEILNKAKGKPALILSSRLEVTCFNKQVSAELIENGLQPFVEGSVYSYGFDFMIANQDVWKLIATHLNDDIPLGMGVPWWDYYIPSLAQKLNVNLFILTPPPIAHVFHEAVYSQKVWINSSRSVLDICFDKEIPEENQKIVALMTDTSNLQEFSRQLIKSIHVNAEEISLGQYISPRAFQQCVDAHSDPNHLAFLTAETYERNSFSS